MKNRKILPLLAALVLAVAVAGCKDPYGACVKAGNTIATGINQSMKTVDQTRSNGLITAQEETSVLNYLEFANHANGDFLRCSASAHTASKAGAFTACAQTFLNDLNNPQQLALIHVSNSTGQQEVSAVVNAITTGVSTVVTSLGGK